MGIRLGFRHDLRRVTMIGGYNDQRVRMVGGILQSKQDSIVERNGFADLFARLRRMRSFVDLGAFHLEKEARRLWVRDLQQTNSLEHHGKQGGLTRGPYKFLALLRTAAGIRNRSVP